MREISDFIYIEHLDSTTWWRHKMETFSALLVFCADNSHSPNKGQWRGALIHSLICAWTNSWANTEDAGDLRSHRAHHDATIMWSHNDNIAMADTRKCYKYVDFSFVVDVMVLIPTCLDQHCSCRCSGAKQAPRHRQPPCLQDDG